MGNQHKPDLGHAAKKGMKMARQIILKTNGKYAIWSSIVDDFIFDDITIEEYIAFRTEEATAEVIKDIREIAEQLERGEKPYGVFTKTYEGACEWRDEVRRFDESN